MSDCGPLPAAADCSGVGYLLPRLTDCRNWLLHLTAALLLSKLTELCLVLLEEDPPLVAPGSLASALPVADLVTPSAALLGEGTAAWTPVLPDQGVWPLYTSLPAVLTVGIISLKTVHTRAREKMVISHWFGRGFSGWGMDRIADSPLDLLRRLLLRCPASVRNFLDLDVSV